MSVGNVLPCCCGTETPWFDCDFTFPTPAPICNQIYTMSDFEATVNYQMRYHDGDQDVVAQWVPQYIPDGCTGQTACELDTQIARSYTPAQLAIRNAQMRSTCKAVGNIRADSPPGLYLPLAGTLVEYEGIEGPTPGSIQFGASQPNTAWPKFEIFTRCNAPPLMGQACPDWGEPHPSIGDGKFEMLVVQTQGVGFAEYCSGSTPTQRQRWLGLGTFVNSFGFRTCTFQAVFLYWRPFSSDPSQPEYEWTPGEYQFYGVRIGVFDYLIPPANGSTGGCGTSQGFSSACSPAQSSTCCCCSATAVGSLASSRRFYASSNTSGACGNGNRLRPSFGMFRWNAALGEPLPPGLEFDCPETLEIG